MRSSILLTTTVLAGLCAGPALAADLYTPPPAAPVVTQPLVQSLWSGVYLGIHGGVGGGTVDYPFDLSFGEVFGASGRGHLDGGGFLAGGQIGYNWVLPNRILLGLEADIAWSDVESRVGIQGRLNGGGDLIGRARASAGTQLDYLGTVRARLGYLVTYPWLVYATGGWAYGRTTSSYRLSVTDDDGDSVIGLSGSRKKSSSGWTAGLGTAYAVTPNLSLRAEYLHVDLGSHTLFSTGGGGFGARLKAEPAYDIVRVGFDYRFDGTAPASVLEPAGFASPATFNWTGLHLGVNGGYGIARNDYPINAALGPYSVGGSADMKGGGFLAGGQIGYDFQLGSRIVLGLEADIDWADVNGQLGLDGRGRIGLSSANVSAGLGTDLDYFGTVRGRLGYAVTDPWLVYATGGWAYGRTTSSIDVDLGGTGFRASKKLNHSGWTAGLGTEFAVTQNLTVRAEYLHADFDSKTLINVGNGEAGARVRIDPDYDFVRVGVNYKFDFGGIAAAAPVVAKY